MRITDNKDLAEYLTKVFKELEDELVVRRLRSRLRELGPNCKDEVKQFRQLQKACREEARLAEALDQAGYKDAGTVSPSSLDAQTGPLIQAFNQVVEQLWEKY